MDILVWAALTALVIGSLYISRRMRQPKRAHTPAAHEGSASDMSGARRIATEPVANGALSIDIYAVSLESSEEPVSCWTYVSQGLWPLGQKEIVFTVKRRRNEADGAYPRDLLALYEAIYQFASRRQVVDIGNITALDPQRSQLLGRKDFVGVLYTPPQAFEEIRVGVPSLTGIILTGNELALSQRYGMVRVMTMLGKRYRFFPTAPWADRDRSELCLPSEMQSSILSNLPGIDVLEASVRQERPEVSRTERPGPRDLRDQSVELGTGRIVLRLRPGAADSLRDATTNVPEDSVLTLLVGPEPSMEACLSWQPGQTTPAAISLSGASTGCVAGNFISFIPKQDADGGVLAEDGFVISLRTETWRSVRDAFTTGRFIHLPGSEGRMGLDVLWVPEADGDFADPIESHLPGGWDLFDADRAGSDVVQARGRFKTIWQNPGVLPAEPTGRVRLKSLSMLTLESIFAGRLDPAACAGYVRALLTAMGSFAERSTSAIDHDVAPVCELGPNDARAIRILVRPEESADDYTLLLDHLRSLPPPPVAFGPVHFQVNLVLAGLASPIGPRPSP
jgi:hypothetical protein